MHARALILWFALVALLTSGCQNESSLAPLSQTDLTAVSLEYRWATPLATPPGQSVGQIWLKDENLYVLTNENLLMCFDARRGLPLWSRQIAEADNEVFEPIHVDDMRLAQEPLSVVQMQEIRPEGVEYVLFDAVAVHSIDRVLVMDRRNGRIHRDIRLRELGIDTVATARGTVAADMFIYPGTDGTYLSIGLQAVVQNWRSSTRSLVYAGLESRNDMVYIGDGSGLLQAINVLRNDDRVLWQKDLETDIVADFLVDEMGCFVAIEDNRLYGFGLLGQMIDGYPVVFEGRLIDPLRSSATSLYVFATDDALYAVDRLTGRKRWRMPEGRYALASRRGEVFVIDMDNHLRVVDEVQGLTRAMVPMTGFVKYVQAPQQPLIYAVTADSKIHCIQKIDPAGDVGLDSDI
jgi:outer membrane protein assembly factor BamB